MVSALIGAGVAMLGLAGVATMITYSQKAGLGARGLSDAGLLTDSIRSILSQSDRCKEAFQVAPAGGGTPIAPALATDGALAQLSSIGTASGGAFTPYATANQKFGSISITGITLRRDSSSLMTLSITARRNAQAAGVPNLEIPEIKVSANFDPVTGSILGCRLGSTVTGSTGAFLKPYLCYCPRQNTFQNTDQNLNNAACAYGNSCAGLRECMWSCVQVQPDPIP